MIKILVLVLFFSGCGEQRDPVHEYMYKRPGVECKYIGNECVIGICKDFYRCSDEKIIYQAGY